MASFVADYIEEAAANYLDIAITAVGTLAGNVVSGVGGSIESSGNAVGNGIAGGIGEVGSYVNSYGDYIRGLTAPDCPARVRRPHKPASRAKTAHLKKAPKATQPKVVSNAQHMRARPSERAQIHIGKMTVSAASHPKKLKAKPASGRSNRGRVGEVAR